MTASRPGADVRALPAPRTAPGEPVDDEAGHVVVDGEQMTTAELVRRYLAGQQELDALRGEQRKISRLLRADLELRPWQVELLKLQRHLEATKMRMIVVFEGRDAAGKGGTIRRVTRYMNEKHYRVVALGRPTEEQRTQWYFQRYVAQFPTGGEIVLFDRSWYNRAMVEPVFGFCTPEEYDNFMRGVTGFEKDLVRQGTVLVKLYFSVTKAEQARRFARRHDDPHDARVGPLDDPLDGPTLARRVAALEQHAHAEPLVDDPLLQLDELSLEPFEVLLVLRPSQPLARRVDERVRAHPLNRPLRMRSASISAISSGPETTNRRSGTQSRSTSRPS